MGTDVDNEIECSPEQVTDQEFRLEYPANEPSGAPLDGPPRKGRVADCGRLDALARLASHMAEEFGDLSDVLVSEVTLAVDRLGAAGKAREPLERLRESATRVADLAQRLREIGVRPLATVELVDLNDVAERFVGLVSRAMPHDVKLEFSPWSTPATLTADPRLLERVLLNLCVNARDAVPRGGRIAIRTARSALAEDLFQEPEGAVRNPYVVLSVSDDGIGMPPAVRDRAFEPFFTTKAPSRRVGLGLSTVYGIVRSHGGMIRLDSEVGKGTTVDVYLPAAARAIWPTEP